MSDLQDIARTAPVDPCIYEIYEVIEFRSVKFRILRCPKTGKLEVSWKRKEEPTRHVFYNTDIMRHAKRTQ